MHKLASVLVLVLSSLLLTACGGGGGGTTSNPETLPVGFVKTSSQFTQYEAIELAKLDACYTVTGMFLNGTESITSHQYGNSYFIQIPASYEAGQYELSVDLANSCVTENNTSTVTLNLDLQQADTVANPDVYLEEKINEAITLIDEMLLTETDQSFIDYLTLKKSELNDYLTAIPTMSAEALQENVQFLVNNEVDLTTSLPVGGVVSDLLSCSGQFDSPDHVLSECQFNWLVISAAGVALGYVTPGLQVAGVASSMIFAYHLKKFYLQAIKDEVWSDLEIKIKDASGVTYLQNEYNSLLSGALISQSNPLVFSQGVAHQLKATHVKKIKTADKNIINRLKASISNIASLLPGSIGAQIASLSTQDKVENIIDISSYSITSISDEQFELTVSTNGDLMNVSFNPVQGVEFTEDVPFIFTLSDSSGHNFVFNSLWKLDQGIVTYQATYYICEEHVDSVCVSRPAKVVDCEKNVVDGLPLNYVNTQGEVVPAIQCWYANGNRESYTSYAVDVNGNHAKWNYVDHLGVEQPGYMGWFEDGTISDINNYEGYTGSQGPDVFNSRTGLSTSYYTDGTLETERELVDGDWHGLYKSYEQASTTANTPHYLWETTTYSHDVEEGLTTRYYPDGSIAFTQMYKNGLKDGLLTEYYPSGSIEAITSYKNDLRDGAYVLYYPNGIIDTEGAYIADKREGIWKWNWDNGIRNLEGAYIAGKREGTWLSYFFEDGSLYFKTPYLNDLKHGTVYRYFQGGTQVSRISYKENGNWSDLSKYYNPDGTLAFTRNEVTGDTVDYNRIDGFAYQISP